MENLLNLLQSQGFELSDLILDGQNWNRCKVNGSTGLNGWVFGFVHGSGVVCAWYNDWSAGDSPKYWDNLSEHKELTPEQQAEIKQEIDDKKLEIEKQKAVQREEAKQKAFTIWSSCSLKNSHSYLTKKKLDGTEVPVSKYGQILVPIYDLTGALCSLQFIAEDGSKKYLKGGYKGYSVIGKSTEKDILYICEGWATGQSIHLATGKNVLVALDAKNMVKLASTLPWLKDYQEIVVAADNDQWTEGNPGVTSALETQKVLHFATPGQLVKVKYPSFSSDDIRKGSDWNDVHTRYGLDVVHSELLSEEEPLPVPAGNGPGAGETRKKLESLVRTVPDAKGKPKIILPTQEQVAREMCDYFGPDIVRQKDDIFIWVNTHWEDQEPKNFRHKIRRMAALLFGGLAKNADLDSCYAMFISMVEPVPGGRDLYTPNRFATTFLDGTLWVEPKTFTLSFEKGHKRENFLTSCLPVKWDVPDEKNELLEKFLDRIMHDDAEKKEKLLALQEMAGQCLLPAFPHIYFNYGSPGSGKSTLAKLCAHMVGTKNRCKVAPQQFQEFMAEGLINKLVNIHTDISKRTIPDDAIKQIEDGEPMYINRKNRSAVDSFIPNLHVWCCNTLPRSTDGDTGSYGRRATIIEYKANLLGDGGPVDKFYENFIWDRSPQGVISWAKQGLLRLSASKGVLTKIKSSDALMKKWNEESDDVAQFLMAVERKEIGPKGAELVKLDDASMRAFDMYKMYREWSKEMSTFFKPISIQKWFDAMKKHGKVFKLHDGYNMVFGYKIKGSTKSGDDVHF